MIKIKKEVVPSNVARSRGAGGLIQDPGHRFLGLAIVLAFVVAQGLLKFDEKLLEENLTFIKSFRVKTAFPICKDPI